MPQILVDGIPYTPATSTNIGIAITVRDRHDVTAETLPKVRALTPAGVPIFIVDDASTQPYEGADFRFDTNVGIPAAKNKCLELLMNAGCQYLFLLDNDCYPIRDDWMDVFCRILDRHGHVSAQFRDLKSSRQLGDIATVYVDDDIEAWTGQRGYCLAYRRDVIERVGGFDTIYGHGLYEHSDLANRIHASGLTTWRYASPKDSHLLVESLDQLLKVQRTPLADRQELAKRNAEIHHRRRDEGYKAFVEYRQTQNVVLTCLYTGAVDPQRGMRMKPDVAALKTLTDSARPHQVVVLCDDLEQGVAGHVTYVKAPNTVNVYFQRWINALQYLECHPEVANVLVCDGTDVEILHSDLFDHVVPGTLMVGSEYQVVGCEWMLGNHPHPGLQQWMRDNGRRQLLNAGLVLGDRATVIEFVRGLVQAWESIEADVFWGKSDGNGVGDMAVFNFVAYKYFADRLDFGPHVTTLFKGEKGNDFSLIRHK
jgi:hypothetical protein